MTCSNAPVQTAIVVNDDNTQLNILAALLRKGGVHAETFLNVEAALAAMDPRHPPELIVTDLYMPGLDGWHFCRLLRAPEYVAYNKVPILIVSATFAGDHPERIAEDAGADGFLPAPVNGKVLLAHVQALLAGKADRSRPQALIVEDDEALARLLQKTFTAHGYQADLALTARAAEEAFAKTPYAVAILDNFLTDGTGDVLLDTFREARPDCVCLMMTGDPSPEMALNWMKRGAAAYLQKPFAPEVLIELCSRARRERALLRTEDLLEARTRELRKSEEQYRMLFSEMLDAFALHEIIVDEAGTPIDYRFLAVNPAFERLTGLKVETVVGHTLLEVLPEIEPYWLETYSQVVRTGEPLFFENYSAAFGKYYEVMAFRPAPNQFACIFQDITARKQAQEELRLDEMRLKALLDLNDMKEATESELMNFAMESAVRLTGSTLGYLALANEDESTLTMFAWSKEAMRQCAIPQQPTLFNVCETGLWGEAIRQRRPIITNDYTEDLPLKKGTPQGHVALTRHMNVPTFDGNRIVLLAGVANKPSKYGESDLRQVNLLMSGLWTILRRRKAEEAIRGQQALLTAIDANAPLIMLVVDAQRQIVHSNMDSQPFRLQSLSKAPHSEFGDALNCLKALTAPKGCGSGERCKECVLRQLVADTLASGQPYSQVEAQFSIASTPTEVQQKTFLVSTTPFQLEPDKMVLVSLLDITLRKLAENERDLLQSELAQTQKMESIGRLAGGVAHDFNNMLQGILGHSELALERVGMDDSLREDLEEIRKVARRSADLTYQLLAFARKQPVVPRVLEINETVEEVLKMLRPLLGEAIDLVWRPATDVWFIKMDPAQLNSILVNLCVNARDAISNVGKLVIKTENVSIDENACLLNNNFRPGEFVRLTVSDNGCGMDAETLNHLFEPFFTTKKQGRGTGLGLASVHGAVAQNQGYIDVSSEPGQGTVFQVYLPRHVNHGDDNPEVLASQEIPTGCETILLVEDDTIILKTTARTLESLGYTVLSASTPHEALVLAREQSGELDLLITDVIMPEMNGRELSTRVLALHPNIRCLFISGYTADIIARQGVLEEGTNFLQKPFQKHLLASKLRTLLEKSKPYSTEQEHTEE